LNLIYGLIVVAVLALIAAGGGIAGPLAFGIFVFLVARVGKRFWIWLRKPSRY